MRLAVILLLYLIAAGTAANAQSYPVRPVTIVVPYAAGGGIDGIARMLAQRLTEKLGQPFVVENRLGAGGKMPVLGLPDAPPV
jgi:tripartite-type tricarboxylate transporter receptor subunit TctC